MPELFVFFFSLQAHEIENYIHDVGVFGFEDNGPLNMQVSLLISDFIKIIFVPIRLIITCSRSNFFHIVSYFLQIRQPIYHIYVVSHDNYHGLLRKHHTVKQRILLIFPK